MPKIAVKMRGSTPSEVSPIAEIPNPHLITLGCSGGIILGSCVNLLGAAAGLVIHNHTGIPKKITCLAGSAAGGAFLVHYLGNSPLSFAIKVGVAAATVGWSVKFGAGFGGTPQEIFANRRITWKNNALLCGWAIAAGGTLLGNPALGTFIGGILSYFIASVGRVPRAHLHEE